MDRIDNHLREISYKSYLKSINFLGFGIIEGIYRILAFSSVIISFLSWLKNQEKINLTDFSPVSSINEYSIPFPIFFYCFDHYSLKQKKKKEKVCFKLTKIFLILFYWCYMTATYYLYKNEKFNRFSSLSKNMQSMINLLNFFIALLPVLACYYSKILIDKEYFSEPSNQQNNIVLNKIEPKKFNFDQNS